MNRNYRSIDNQAAEQAQHLKDVAIQLEKEAVNVAVDNAGLVDGPSKNAADQAKEARRLADKWAGGAQLTVQEIADARRALLEPLLKHYETSHLQAVAQRKAAEEMGESTKWAVLNPQTGRVAHYMKIDDAIDTFERLIDACVSELDATIDEPEKTPTPNREVRRAAAHARAKSKSTARRKPAVRKQVSK